MDVGELDGKEVCVCTDLCTFSCSPNASANFQQDPYSHFEDYQGHRNRHINTNCSISIRLMSNISI